MAETGYFLVADVLGFSSIVENESAERIDDRIAEWVNLVELAQRNCQVERCNLFSDTVFACAESSGAGLKALVTFAKELLSVGLEKCFMLRGGIAHGSFTWGHLSYGKAIIDAHKIESRQNWIGVSCQGGLPHVDGIWGADGVVCYLPPMKGGLMQAQPAVSWEIPDARRLTEQVMKSNAVKDGGLISWEVGEKLSNTLLFRSYLRILRRENLDPSRFYGPLPSQIVDEVISKRAYAKNAG